MIDVSKYGLSTKLASAIGPNDLFLMVNEGLAGAMTPAAGTHYYLTLEGPASRREIVLVTGATGTKIYVERGVDNTDALSWPAGTCLYFGWNPAQLCEQVSSCLSGTTSCIKPGCYRLTCDTVITLNAAGQITNIDGEAEECSGA